MKFILCLTFYVALVSGAAEISTQGDQRKHNQHRGIVVAPVKPPGEQPAVAMPQFQTQIRYIPVNVGSLGGFNNFANPLVGQSPTQFSLIPISLSGSGIGSGGSLVGQSQSFTNAPTQFRLVPVSLLGGGFGSSSEQGFGQGFLVGGNTGLTGGGWMGLSGFSGLSGGIGGWSGLSLIDFIKKKK